VCGFKPLRDFEVMKKQWASALLSASVSCETIVRQFPVWIRKEEKTLWPFGDFLVKYFYNIVTISAFEIPYI